MLWLVLRFYPTRARPAFLTLDSLAKSSKLWLIIELNLRSTVLPNFIPEFENPEIFSPAASLIFLFKNIHQTLERNSELHFNDLHYKSCLRNLQIKASRI